MVDSKGFSLIELVVAAAILVVLAGIAIPIYSNALYRAQYTELIANVKIYQDAAHSAMTKHGYPDETIVWGDSEEEASEWNEGNWIIDGIDNGILVTIDIAGDVEISFEEGSENYDKYIRLTDMYGQLDDGA